MADPQDVRQLVPRVRRALEGPVQIAGGLSDAEIEAVTADAIADLILLTAGEWKYTLAVSEVDDDTQLPLHYAVSPELSLVEQSLVAAQAALTQIFHSMRDVKTSERIANEGQEWEYSRSASLLRDWLAALQKQRDDALAALEKANPIMVRVSSILAVRDRLASQVIEPWLHGQIGAG